MNTKEENIFLFIPNIVGYFRIIFALFSCYHMKSDYAMAIFWYLLSALMDAVDGFMARHFNQMSRFGSVLDQITDRCATLVLVMMLAYFYPDYMIFFQLVNIIDIAGHWIHIWSSLMMGKLSHKYIDLNENFILRLYYTSKPVLFFMCAGNEIFYSSLYLLHFTEGFKIPCCNEGIIKILVKITAPIAIVKILITLNQMIVACINVARLDSKERSKAVKSNQFHQKSTKVK